MHSERSNINRNLYHSVSDLPSPIEYSTDRFTFPNSKISRKICKESLLSRFISSSDNLTSSSYSNFSLHKNQSI